MTTVLLPPVSCTYITRTPTNLLIVYFALAPFPDSAVNMGTSLGFPITVFSELLIAALIPGFPGSVIGPLSVHTWPHSGARSDAFKPN